METNFKKRASNISCVATGARPAPKFKWTIGDNEILNSNTTNSEELLDEGRGKVNFFQISIFSCYNLFALAATE